MTDKPTVQEPTVGLIVRQRSRRGIPFASVKALLPAPPKQTWLWLGAATALVAAVAGIVGQRIGANVPEGGPAAAQQAAAVDALLDQSPAGRRYLLTAIDDINACAVNGTTVANIRVASSARWDLLALANEAVVTDLPHGVEIKTELKNALRTSYDADEAYLEWVIAAGDECPRHGDPAYAAVADANEAAQEAKRRFLAWWNPVARRYGLDQRSATVI